VGVEGGEAPLPPAFYNDMEKYLYSYKKESKKAQWLGKLNKDEADPISWSLFLLFCNSLNKTKADQADEKVRHKHMYGNTTLPIANVFLGLGV